jgi:hypothetical protein
LPAPADEHLAAAEFGLEGGFEGGEVGAGLRVAFDAEGFAEGGGVIGVAFDLADEVAEAAL